MKINKENLILISALIGFVLLFSIICVIVYTSGGLPGVDVAVRDFAYDIRGEKYGFVYWVFRILTEFGDIFFILILAVIAAIYTKMDNRFWLLAFGIILSTLLNMAFKEVFSRERPIEAFRWQDETSNSYPSGHSNNVAISFSFIMFVIFKSDHKKWIKNTTYIASTAIILIVMLSRIILGVHYFTDVVAGMSCGLSVGILCMLLLNYFNEHNILTKGLILQKRKED